MAAGATYTPIATTTLSSASTISFTSIPSTYTDLYVVIRGVTNGPIIKIQYNADTGSNYSSTLIWGDGSSAASARYSEAWTYVIPGGSASDQLSLLVNIQNYSNTTTYKTSIARANVPDASTTASVQLWRSTSAINRVDFLLSGAGTITGTASLYGITAA